MDIEPITNDRHVGFSYSKTQKLLKSHMWSLRQQALEDFLKYLIALQPSDIMNQMEIEKEF